MAHKKVKNSRMATGHGESEHETAPIGWGNFANMPTEVHMEMYPKANEYGAGVLDDTIRGVDKSNKSSDEKSRKYVSNQH